MEPKVAIDAAGNSTVVWIQQFPNTPQVVSNRFSMTSGWGTPAVISSTVNASRPQIASDGSGGAIAIWDQLFDGIWSSRFTPGAGWSAPEVVGASNGPGALYPRVAFASDGTAIAVWQQGDGSRINIWANRRTAAGWGSPTLVETSDAGYAEEPELAVDAGGDAIVMWRQRQTSNSLGELWANNFRPGVGWGTPQLIGTDVQALSYQLRFDGRGNALAVWADFANSSWATLYLAGQGWGTPFRLGPASAPRVAFDAQGNALVLWIQQDAVPNPVPCIVLTSIGGGSTCPATVLRKNLWSRRHTPADGWAQPQLVDTSDLGDVSSPAFAFDQAGNAIAVWTQRVDNLFSGVVTVWANRYTNGTGWGTATVIQDQATGDAMVPSVAVNAAGEAIVAWGQLDGSHANVWANRLH